MTRIASAGLAATLLAASLAAQAPDSFKLGRFAQNGRTFLGVVVNDKTVVEISGVTNLKVLIADYASQRSTLRDLAARARTGKGTLEVASLDTLAPIPDPLTFLSAAMNYTEHAEEMSRGKPAPQAKAPPSIPGIWERQAGDTRHNPYMFPKLPAAITGDGDPIRVPVKRSQVDWECELSIVIGRTADHVTPDEAKDYLFGFTLVNDVSDRGGRTDGRHGSDWLIGKSQATFAPMGPFVVPHEFVPDPQNLAIKFALNGKVMQDSSTNRMTHSVYELLSYASHIIPLQPGDIITTGSPAGVGTARATPIYMKPGDLSVCSIERIGTLTNPVLAASPGTYP